MKIDPLKPPRKPFAWAASLLLVLLVATPLLAKPSQTDVFKSIQDNVGNSDGEGLNPIPWICAGVGLIIVLAIFSKRQTRQNTPKVVNHSGRLLKEIMKSIPLRPKELKQLKTVAEEISQPDEDAVNPLVLVLCPSVVIRTVNDRTTRADRRTLAQMLKRMGYR